MKQPAYISPVRHDTHILLMLLCKEKVGKALELGCGTGYLSITLAKMGWEVEGTETTKEILSVSIKNARIADVDVKFFESDVFSDVKGTFDAVVFNPPIVFSTSKVYQCTRGLVARIKPLNAFLEYVLSRFPNRQRSELIERFFAGAKTHLMQGGKAYLVILNNELPSLQGYVRRFELEKVGGMSSVLIFSRADLR